MRVRERLAFTNIPIGLRVRLTERALVETLAEVARVARRER